MRLLRTVSSLAAAVLLLSGCFFVPAGTANTRNRYERCTVSTDSCEGITTCQASNTTTDPSMTTVGAFCTYKCNASGECPTSRRGVSMQCVFAGAIGQCYEACSPTQACSSGFTCSQPPGMAAFCIPNAGSTTTPTLSAYDRCTSASTCASGTTCRQSLLSTRTDGMSGNFCTTSCTLSSQCPAAGSASGLCAIPQGQTTGQCFAPCGTADACPTNYTCGQVGTTKMCVPNP